MEVGSLFSLLAECRLSRQLTPAASCQCDTPEAFAFGFGIDSLWLRVPSGTWARSPRSAPSSTGRTHLTPGGLSAPRGAHLLQLVRETDAPPAVAHAGPEIYTREALGRPPETARGARGQRGPERRLAYAQVSTHAGSLAGHACCSCAVGSAVRTAVCPAGCPRVNCAVTCRPGAVTAAFASL